MWVERVKELLGRAKAHRVGAWGNLDALKSSIDGALHAVEQAKLEERVTPVNHAPYPIRRRNLLAQIGLKGKHYGLQDEIQAFVYATGHMVIQELDNDQLSGLHIWLTQWVDNMQAACDSPYSPPAR